jgi:hypothetical protein
MKDIQFKPTLQTAKSVYDLFKNQNSEHMGVGKIKPNKIPKDTSYIDKDGSQVHTSIMVVNPQK